jgi:hypothetical protein
MQSPAIVALLAGCAAATVACTDAATQPAPVNGVQFAITREASSVPPGRDIVFTLRFSNQSDRPVRIYLVRNERFRFGQSNFAVHRAADGTPVATQPAPQAHGYIVSEEDFHLIAPGETFSDRQTLEVSSERLEAGEAYIVTWAYENRITRWPGGVRTVDGPTKPLFDGKEIPFVWVGKVQVETRIQLAAEAAATRAREEAGESIGTATMEPDGTITLRLRAPTQDSGVGEALITYAPDHPEYRRIKEHLGGLAPGGSVSVSPWPEE